MSDTMTEGVRVQVRPRYHPEYSDPNRPLWFFSYTVEVSNHGAASVQLLSRHWRITDSTGHVEEVQLVQIGAPNEVVRSHAHEPERPRVGELFQQADARLVEYVGNVRGFG